MKKLLFALVLLIAGCGGPQEEITTYVSSNNIVKLKIRHSYNGQAITVEINSAKEAKDYKERMQKIIRAIEDFEKELTIREKN